MHEPLKNLQAAREPATGSRAKIIDYSRPDEFELDLHVLSRHGINITSAEKPRQLDRGELGRPSGGSRYTATEGRIFLEPEQLERARALRLSAFDHFEETVPLSDSSRDEITRAANVALQKGDIKLDRGRASWDFDNEGKRKSSSIGAATIIYDITTFEHVSGMTGVLAAMESLGIRPIEASWDQNEQKGCISLTQGQASKIEGLKKQIVK